MAKLYWLVLGKLVYLYCSVPCTLALEYCMMLCKMSLDRHLFCQGFFMHFGLFIWAGWKWVKCIEFLLILHKLSMLILHPSKMNFYKIAQNGCLCALDTSILKGCTHWKWGVEPLNFRCFIYEHWPIEFDIRSRVFLRCWYID